MNPVRIEKIEDHINYPNQGGWYDFSRGVDVQSDQINEWIQDIWSSMRLRMLAGESPVHGTTRSGNTLVLMDAYRDEAGFYSVSCYVAKCYEVAEVCDVDPTVDLVFDSLDPAVPHLE